MASAIYVSSSTMRILKLNHPFLLLITRRKTSAYTFSRRVFSGSHDCYMLIFMSRISDPSISSISRIFKDAIYNRSEEHTSELQSRFDLVCRLLLEKKK